jgi:hypothetical protein
MFLSYDIDQLINEMIIHRKPRMLHLKV